MKTQRGFLNTGILIAIVLGVVVFGSGTYFFLQQNPFVNNIDNPQDLPTADNQTQQTGALSGVANKENQRVSTENNFGLQFDRLSDYIQKIKKSAAPFNIQDNHIVYLSMPGVTVDGVPSSDCTLPITNINSALVLASVDDRYLIADNKLFWQCDTVGPIDTVNLRAFLNPRVVLSDGRSVIAEGKKLSVLDPKTFKPVTYTEGRDANERNFTSYYADSVSVYYVDTEDAQIKKLPNSNPATFVILTGRTSQNYAKDINHAYFDGIVLPTKNLKEFEVFANGSYAIDDNAIYVNGTSLITGIRKGDIEVYSSNLPESQQYSGTQDILIKNKITDTWQLYKFEEISLSHIATPATKEIGQIFFPKP